MNLPLVTRILRAILVALALAVQIPALAASHQLVVAAWQ
jgi:hypothetical protein